MTMATENGKGKAGKLKGCAVTKRRGIDAKEDTKFRERLGKVLEKIPPEFYSLIVKRAEDIAEGIRQRTKRI
jgi:hypothetical protein